MATAFNEAHFFPFQNFEEAVLQRDREYLTKKKDFLGARHTVGFVSKRAITSNDQNYN